MKPGLTRPPLSGRAEPSPLKRLWPISSLQPALWPRRRFHYAFGLMLGCALNLAQTRKSWKPTLGIAAILLVTFLTGLGCRRSTGNDGQTNTANVDTSSSSTPVVTTNTTVTATNVAQPSRPPLEQELQRLSRSFAERYGSYSNQTNFANLENLFVFMTPSLQRTTQRFIDDERAKQRDTSVYYGITTRVISVETKSFSENSGTASFVLHTYRRESIGTTSNSKTFEQALTITMQKDDGTWKVADAVWEKR